MKKMNQLLLNRAVFIVIFIVFTFTFYTCDHGDDPLPDQLPQSLVWSNASDMVINEMKAIYDSESGNNQRKNSNERVMWGIATQAIINEDEFIISAPIVSPMLMGKLKVLFMFHGEYGVSSYITEQTPEQNYFKENGLLIKKNFSGEISLYNLKGDVKAQADLENGEVMQSEGINGISKRPLSTLRSSGLEDDIIILDEIVIEGTRIHQGSNWVWLSTGPLYYDITGVFPGSFYDGFYSNQHNYLTPMGGGSGGSNNFYLNFNAGQLVDIGEIINCFSDGKIASSRSITIYVDQPIKNSREPWANYGFSVDVGHTFFKFTKINTDGTKVERIIGYYPKNGDVNPIIGDHTDTGSFRNDNNHSYDVSITYPNVSGSEFQFALGVLNTTYGTNSTYDLNNKNCTDAALQIGHILGPRLPDTQGSWINGGGSNPADFAEDIRGLMNNSSYIVDKTGGRATSSQGYLGGC